VAYRSARAAADNADGRFSPRCLARRVPPSARGLPARPASSGQNATIEYRWAEGRYDRLPALAAELVRQRVSVLVAVGGEDSALVAKGTTTIPMVFLVLWPRRGSGAVIKLGEVVMILDLHRQGLTVSAIARELRIDRYWWGSAALLNIAIGIGDLTLPTYGTKGPHLCMGFLFSRVLCSRRPLAAGLRARRPPTHRANHAQVSA